MKFTQSDVDAYNSKRLPVLSDFGAWIGRESELHSQIEQELKMRRWYYVHSRTDKRTTTQLGVTDFIIAKPDGKTIWCEVKKKGSKLSQEQTITRHVLMALGHFHVTVFSFEDFLKAINH